MAFSKTLFLYLATIVFTVQGDSDCSISSDLKLQSETHSEFSEIASKLQAEWVDQDKILVVTSSDGSSGTSVWLGAQQKSTGLFRFTKGSDKGAVESSVDLSSLVVSPASLSTVYMISSDHEYLYTSDDGGDTWSKHSLPTTNFNEDLLLSRVSSSRLCLVTHDGDLYLSNDRGASWSNIASDVALATLSHINDKEFIFYSTFSDKNHVLPLHRYNIEDMKDVVIDPKAYRFYVDNRYLFVSRQNNTDNAPLTRRFYVSTDYTNDKWTFGEVQIPSSNWEDYVLVLATHELGAFIHVSNGKDKEKGKLYVSDISGVRFTLSLDNHLMARITIFATITLHDFYEVSSMRGVYITTAVRDDGHHTVITYNNGGSWSDISAPDGSCDGCTLHLHLKYSMFHSTALYNSSFQTGPLSSANAVGLVLAHGSISKVRDYDPKHSVIVVSQDGGHTWKKTNIPGGHMYSYGIADYGNIIAAMENDVSAEILWFSHDRGDCFKQEQFDSSNYFNLNKGLLMDPRGTSLMAFALGLEGNGDNDAWRLITLNFGTILSSPCHDSDYELVTEHQISDTCLLGYKQQYKITKATSVCYNGKDYSPDPVKTILCNCTYNDLECDYGFTPLWKDDILTCEANKFHLSLVCPPGEDHYYQSKSGLRMVTGDRCKHTDTTKKLVKPVKQVCTGHEQDSGIDTPTDDTHKVSLIPRVSLIPTPGTIEAFKSKECCDRCDHSAGDTGSITDSTHLCPQVEISTNQLSR